MAFVKLNEYIVNVDHILYIEDHAKDYAVYFTSGDGKSIVVNVVKGSEAGANLKRAIEERSK